MILPTREDLQNITAEELEELNEVVNDILSAQAEELERNEPYATRTIQGFKDAAQGLEDDAGVFGRAMRTYYGY